MNTQQDNQSFNRRQSNNRKPNMSNTNNNNSTDEGLMVANASVSRGAAVRAQKRSQADAQKIANQYAAANQTANPARRANFIDDSPRLKFIALGGMDGGGSKNMIIIEYMNDAVVIDCGNDLGVDLPGINY